MKQIKLLFYVMFFSLLSCTSEVNEPENFTLSDSSETITGVASEEDAILFANKCMDQLTGKTRSNRSVSNVKLVNLSGKDDNHTRSVENEDVVTYLVNYEDEEGFVLMSGTTSSCVLLAISDESNLNISDTTENKALATVLKSLMGVTPPPTVIGPADGLTINLDSSPLLSEYVRKWGQREPFNSEVPLEKNSTRHCAVGCAPLAAAMIMTYCEWPESYKGYTFDWDAIKKGNADNQIAMLLKFIGDKDAMWTTYGGANGSGTYITDIPSGFEELNYSFGNGFKSYPAHLPWFVPIRTQREPWTYCMPAYMIGEMDYDGGRVGHAWIVDGRMTVHYDPMAYLGKAPEDDIYMHCVWGHYGRGNGYFLVRNNGIGGDRYTTDSKDGAYPGYDFSSSTYDWTYNLKYNQTILPNK